VGRVEQGQGFGFQPPHGEADGSGKVVLLVLCDGSTLSQGSALRHQAAHLVRSMLRGHGSSSEHPHQLGQGGAPCRPASVS